MSPSASSRSSAVSHKKHSTWRLQVYPDPFSDVLVVSQCLEMASLQSRLPARESGGSDRRKEQETDFTFQLLLFFFSAMPVHTTPPHRARRLV